MGKFMSKEFWFVVVSDMDAWSDTREYHVFASNAATAEVKALNLARRDALMRAYVKSAEHIGYIEA